MTLKVNARITFITSKIIVAIDKTSTLVVAIAIFFFHIKFIVAIDFGQSLRSIFCIPAFFTFPPIFSLSPAFFLFPQFVPSLCNYFAFPIRLLRKLRAEYSSTKQSFDSINLCFLQFVRFKSLFCRSSTHLKLK
jgi:hypothetical protein